MSTYIPNAEDNKGIVKQLKDYVGDDRILLSPVAFGARQFVQPFEQALKEGGVDFFRKDVMHEYFETEDYGPDGRVRPRNFAGFLKYTMEEILEMFKEKNPAEVFMSLEKDLVLPASEIGTSHGAKWWVFYDDDIHKGRAALGAAQFAFENSDVLGIENVLLVVELDTAGIAHVARIKKYDEDEYMGLKLLAKHNLRKGKRFKYKNLHLITEPMEEGLPAFGLATSAYIPSVPRDSKRPKRGAWERLRSDDNWFKERFKKMLRTYGGLL